MYSWDNLLFYMMIWLFSLIFMPMACTIKSKEAKAILQNEGCAKIELTGYEHFSCASGESYNTGFVCKSGSAAIPDRSGVVCTSGYNEFYSIKWAEKSLTEDKPNISGEYKAYGNPKSGADRFKLNPKHFYAPGSVPDEDN